ncbi:MAG TPA: hypothetical protein VEF71_20045 [Streptosporangiaceae bacterium]|nr:hypothetical protein [Streptosporangiaceae bacterium]
MSHRRLVAIDLGIATAHTVRVLDGGERSWLIVAGQAIARG